jgi:hypothetical protein
MSIMGTILHLSPITERTFPCRVAPFDGAQTVTITTFGLRMNGQDGCQGSITGIYTHAALWTYTQNTLAHTDAYQATSIRFEVAIPNRPADFVGLSRRCAALALTAY